MPQLSTTQIAPLRPCAPELNTVHAAMATVRIGTTSSGYLWRPEHVCFALDEWSTCVPSTQYTYADL